MSVPSSVRQYLPSAVPSAVNNLRRGFTGNPSISNHEKFTLQTHQTTAEDDLLSITEDLFTPILNNEIDQQQISAWNHHAKYGPFRVHYPVKQVFQPPGLQPKNSLPAKFSEKYELKSELKAKLRHYQLSKSIPFNSQSAAEIDIQMPIGDYWKNIETLDLEKLSTPSVSSQKLARKKAMILQPFYSMSGRKTKKFEKRAKSTNSHQSRDQYHSRSSSSHKEANNFRTIVYTSELKFPIISDQTKLQDRLTFYRKKCSVSN